MLQQFPSSPTGSAIRLFNESFVDYFKRFQMLSSQMKETQDMKETTKICTMNDGPASWFPSGSLYRGRDRE